MQQSSNGTVEVPISIHHVTPAMAVLGSQITILGSGFYTPVSEYEVLFIQNNHIVKTVFPYRVTEGKIMAVVPLDIPLGHYVLSIKELGAYVRTTNTLPITVMSVPADHIILNHVGFLRPVTADFDFVQTDLPKPNGEPSVYPEKSGISVPLAVKGMVDHPEVGLLKRQVSELQAQLAATQAELHDVRHLHAQLKAAHKAPEHGHHHSAEAEAGKRQEPEHASNKKTYVVKHGDSLWAIARKFYGDGKCWRKILEANTNQIKNPKTLKTGISIVIPAVA